MKKIILNFSGIINREEIHDYLISALKLPQYYGKNLDALYEILIEWSLPVCIGLFYTEPQKKGYFLRLLEVFKAAEAENDNLGVVFSCLKDNLI